MADDHQVAMTIVCGNPDCRVAETGRCVEGHELNVCPYYGQEDEDGEIAVDWNESEVPAEGVRLLGADTLTPPEASAVLRGCDARVIAVIGPSDAGKTSLIASIYDLFQEGPVGEIQFSRSRTLHAFELSCHDARAASRRNTPHMNRTPIGEVRFYHLELGGGGAEEGLALLLGDRAGEEYRATADDVTVAAGFVEVGRADALTVLIDGERLTDSGARHNLRSDTIMMLQGLHDGGVLPAAARLALVLTKLDVVSGSASSERAQRDFAVLLSDIRRLFSASFSEIETFQVAASPKTDAVLRGTGIPELLNFWIKPRQSARVSVPTRQNFERIFARLRPLDESMEEAHG